jgi:putative FmdB family regulatory protein
MPTYEYACKSCGEHVEVVQSFKDEPLTECPACGGPLRKVFGSIGIAFKGSGFYKTDSRVSSSASNGEAKKSEGATPASGDGKSDSTTTKADGSKPSSDGSKPSSDRGSTSSPKESKPAASTAS